MKYLKLFAVLSVMLAVAGCSKTDESYSDELAVDQTEYVLAYTNTGFAWEEAGSRLVKDPVNDHASTELTIRSNSAHTHGSFDNPGIAIDFSGTENPGGVHGSANVQISNPAGSAELILATSSVVVNGNTAIYGGLITEVVENTLPPPPPPPPGFPAPPCSPFDLGTYVYFQVVDNGQGANADPDQYSVVIFPPCFESANGAATFPWFIFPYSEIGGSPQHIKVN